MDKEAATMETESSTNYKLHVSKVAVIKIACKSQCGQSPQLTL